MDGRTIVGEELWILKPRTPIDLKPPPVKTQLGEQDFKTVNNPGQWSEFTLRPVFAEVGYMYKRYVLPTGLPLPQAGIGTRQSNGWEFHYNY